VFNTSSNQGSHSIEAENGITKQQPSKTPAALQEADIFGSKNLSKRSFQSFVQWPVTI
jgi:hypothetical protein